MEKLPPHEPEIPSWVINNSVAKEEFEYNGKKIPYWVFKKEARPEFPGFVVYYEPDNIIYLSEEIPATDRPHYAKHEYIEFNELKGQSGRCTEALRREIAELPEDITEAYLKTRADFFARLNKLYANSEDVAFIEEIQKSYNYLLSL